MGLPEASVLARWPFSRKDQHLQPIPASWSVALLLPLPPSPAHLSSARAHAPPLAPPPSPLASTFPRHFPHLTPNPRSLAQPSVCLSPPLPHPLPTPTPSPRYLFAHPPHSLAFALPPSPSPLSLPRGWPCALGCSSATPDNGPPRRGGLHIPAEAGGVCVVVRLSPPVLRSGLRWLIGYGDDPVGCG